MRGATDFVWDHIKAAANVEKHGVTFEEAIEAFLDPRSVDYDVSRAEDQETRRKRVGRIGDRLFSVVYTPRGPSRRIISARPANVSEKRLYGDDHLQT